MKCFTNLCAVKVISVNNVRTNLSGACLCLKGLLMGSVFLSHICRFIIDSSPPGAVSNPTARPHIIAHSFQLPQIPGWGLSSLSFPTVYGILFLWLQFFQLLNWIETMLLFLLLLLQLSHNSLLWKYGFMVLQYFYFSAPHLDYHFFLIMKWLVMAPRTIGRLWVFLWPLLLLLLVTTHLVRDLPLPFVTVGASSSGRDRLSLQRAVTFPSCLYLDLWKEKKPS